LVLARAAAGYDGDADASERHGGGAGGGVVVGVGVTKRPTVIVTVDFFGASVPPVGSWVSTTPSEPGSVVSCDTICTLKPDALSVETASAWATLVTSGTREVFGPFETLTVTVVPFGRKLPAIGSWSTTVSAGWSFSTSFRATAKPWACSRELAVAKLSPITEGTATGCGPFETLMRTTLPAF